MPDPAPQLTAAQGAVDAVCTVFGWDYRFKAGHAAGWAKRARTKLGLSLPEFIGELVTHYGRVDPGAGEWWVYREVYPCSKVAGAMPTPQMVENTWGRWTLATAVQLPARQAQSEPAGYAALRALREAQGR
jgi:hypothetical protein